MKIHIVALLSALHLVCGYSVYKSVGNIYEQHVPVIKDGVPVETPEVQAAKAQHYAAVAKASALASKNYYEKPIYEEPQDQRYYKPAPAFWISSNNIPQDTPEVAAAKAAHLAALHSANSLQLNDNDDGQYREESYYQQPTRIQNVVSQYRTSGVPVDTLEVQQAKQAHLSALTRATSRRYRRSLFDQHVPVITKDGVPEDTLEVQHARAEHLLAHAKAQHGSLYESSGHLDGGYGSAYSYGSHDSNVHYAIHHEEGQKYYGPQHYPILDKDGVPVETEEVQEAKRQHFLAHAGYQLQQPVEETPEVQLARAEHLAAHAKEAASHSGHSHNQYDDVDGSYGYGTIAGYLGDSEHDTTVYGHGHSQVTKTSSHIKHEHIPLQHYHY